MAIPEAAILSVAYVAAIPCRVLAERVYLTPPGLASLLSRLRIEAKVEKYDAGNGSPNKNALPPSLPTPLRDNHVVLRSLAKQ